MKFAGGLAVLMSACLPLAVACGSAGDTSFFSERGGAPDPGVLGNQSGNVGLSEAGANERGGTGGSVAGVGGRPSTGASGKGGAGASGSSGSSGSSSAGETNAGGASGSTSAGSAGAAAHAGSVSAGSGGSAGAIAGSGGAAGAGASAGKGGAASAGTGGTAGASAGAGGNAAGAGGVSGAWNGWGGAGGWNGWGGSSGSSGSGGASACPAIPPQKNTSCDVLTPNSCFYAGQACSCIAAGLGPISLSKKWACYGDGADCPSAKPTAGASCKASADAECPYPGNDYCVCSSNGDEAHWVCQTNPPVCSANKPIDDSCSTVKTCSWGPDKEVACFCNGSRWGCEGGF